MTQPLPDTLHYVRLPGGQGARAEMTRMVYVLAERPYVDKLWSYAEAADSGVARNPFRQFPFVETASGEVIYQTLAIMHRAAHGTPAWPADPAQLTTALAVAMGGYDLYQAFGGFPAGDEVAKKKFEGRRVPQFFGALGRIYAEAPFAVGDGPTFADCIVHESVAWCVRRNEVARAAFEASPGLVAFRDRFEAVPAIAAFMKRQAAARELDDSV